MAGQLLQFGDCEGLYVLGRWGSFHDIVKFSWEFSHVRDHAREVT
jgi:hypothetical protein